MGATDCKPPKDEMLVKEELPAGDGKEQSAPTDLTPDAMSQLRDLFRTQGQLPASAAHMTLWMRSVSTQYKSMSLNAVQQAIAKLVTEGFLKAAGAGFVKV